MFLRLQSAVAIITCSCLISTASATPSSETPSTVTASTATASTIGFVMSPGKVEVDGSSVQGNSAIFSGGLVSSGDAILNVQFSDGTNAVMNPGATMKVYREHSVLQKGVTMQRGVDKHAVLADGLKISGATPNAVALIRVNDASHVDVAAQAGETDVWSSSGNLVARVEPGKALSFGLLDANTSGIPANGVRIHGILRPNYLLTDERTNVTYRLQGSGLDAFIGASVAVTGTVLGGNPASNTPPVVAVTDVEKLDNVYAEMAQDQQEGARPAGRKRRGVFWWLNKDDTIAALILIALVGTLIGLAASGAIGTGKQCATPYQPSGPCPNQ